MDSISSRGNRSWHCRSADIGLRNFLPHARQYQTVRQLLNISDLGVVVISLLRSYYVRVTHVENEKIRVPVLLEKLPGETVWTASIPYEASCASEGETPEAAVENLEEAIVAVQSVDPRVIDRLRQVPEYLLTTVNISTSPPPSNEPHS